MRWVPEALTTPSRCAVLPYIGRSHPKGYFDTGSELPGKGDQFDCHVYVSVVAAEEMARKLGWHSPEEMVAVQEEIARLETLAETAERELDAAEQILAGIDALESRDFRARRKTGRPPKKKNEEVPA